MIPLNISELWSQGVCEAHDQSTGPDWINEGTVRSGFVEDAFVICISRSDWVSWASRVVM